ncbi:MAG: ribbon-helix-helix protein, CopG family [Candidatus Altiarchaeia archaeon]|jgi:Arc/MetJ-type ribon-helix-helix transcriptional regulator
MSVHINVRISDDLAKKIDDAVKEGVYSSRSDAVKEALLILSRSYEMDLLEKRMKVLAEKNKGKYNATDAVIGSREEED